MSPIPGQITLFRFSYVWIGDDTIHFILDSRLKGRGLLFHKPSERRRK